MGIGIVVCGHPGLPTGLVKSCEMILGRQDGLASIELGPEEAPASFQERIRRAVAELDRGEGVLILVDLFGGTPANQAAELPLKPGIRVAGANLPMILEACTRRDSLDLAELADAVREAGTLSHSRW